MKCPHTVEMMVLSRATRNMVPKTEISRRTVLSVDGFCWGSSGLLASGLLATSGEVSPACVVATSDESPAADLAPLGVVGREDTMVTVKPVAPPWIDWPQVDSKREGTVDVLMC